MLALQTKQEFEDSFTFKPIDFTDEFFSGDSFDKEPVNDWVFHEEIEEEHKEEFSLERILLEEELASTGDEITKKILDTGKEAITFQLDEPKPLIVQYQSQPTPYQITPKIVAYWESSTINYSEKYSSNPSFYSPDDTNISYSKKNTPSDIFQGSYTLPTNNFEIPKMEYASPKTNYNLEIPRNNFEIPIYARNDILKSTSPINYIKIASTVHFKESETGISYNNKKEEHPKQTLTPISSLEIQYGRLGTENNAKTEYNAPNQKILKISKVASNDNRSLPKYAGLEEYSAIESNLNQEPVIQKQEDTSFPDIVSLEQRLILTDIVVDNSINLENMIGTKIAANDNEIQDYSKLKIDSNKAYVALEARISKEDMGDDNYLKVLENLLTKAGYRVGVQEVTYRDTETGEYKTGSILVDKDNSERFYHVLINGELPDFSQGDEESPLAQKANLGDYVQVIAHDRDLDEIKKLSNNDPNKKKKYCDVKSKRVEDEFSGKQLGDVIRENLIEEGYSHQEINKMYDSGALNISIQTIKGEMGGRSMGLSDKIGSKIVSFEYSIDNSKNFMRKAA